LTPTKKKTGSKTGADDAAPIRDQEKKANNNGKDEDINGKQPRAAKQTGDKKND